MTSESSIKVLPAGVFIPATIAALLREALADEADQIEHQIVRHFPHCIVGPQTGYWAPCEAHKPADARRRIYRAVLSVLETAEREPAAADAGA